MKRPLFSHTTLPFQAGAKELELDLRIDALRLAVDVHLATLQLPEGERPYLGQQLHTTARAIARRLSRGRIVGVSSSLSRSERAAARLVYLLRLARDLGWLPKAVARVLEGRAESLRARLAREPREVAASPAPSPIAALPSHPKPMDDRRTLALLVRPVSPLAQTLLVAR